MSAIKHTQLPWFTHGRYIGTKNHKSAVGEVRDVNGNWSNDAKSSADAAFIVEACNSYYENRTALSAKDAEIARLREALRSIAETRWDTDASEACLCMIQVSARAALQATSGGEADV